MFRSQRKLIEVSRVPSRRLFNSSAAAAYLGIKKRKLYQLVHDRVLVPKLMGNRLMFTIEDLQKFVGSLPDWDYNHAGENPNSPEEEVGDEEEDEDLA